MYVIGNRGGRWTLRNKSRCPVASKPGNYRGTAGELCSGTTRQGVQTQETTTPTRHAYMRPKFRSTTIPSRRHGQVHMVPSQATTGPQSIALLQYSADSENRTPRAGVCLHVQKLRPQASIKSWIKKYPKLSAVYNKIQKMMGVGQL